MSSPAPAKASAWKPRGSPCSRAAPFAHVWRISEGKLKRFDMYTDTLLVARAMSL